MHAPSFTSPKWPHQSVAESCAAHAATLRAKHQDGTAMILPSATVADLIITLERAARGLR